MLRATIALGGLGAACGPPPRELEAAHLRERTAGGGPLPASASSRRAAPATAEAVRILVPGLPQSLAPWRLLDALGDRIARDMVFVGLVRGTPHGYPWVLPAVADRCIAGRRRAARGARAEPGEGGAEPASAEGRAGVREDEGDATAEGRSAGLDVPSPAGNAARRPGAMTGTGSPPTSTGREADPLEAEAGAAPALPAPTSADAPPVAGGPTLGAVDPAHAEGRVLAVDRVFCHIPASAQFHDGRPITGEDVVASVRAFLDPRARELRLSLGLSDLDGAVIQERPPQVTDGPHVVVGDEAGAGGVWVRIDFSHPDPLALERLASVSILPARDIRRVAQPRVGAGPFRLHSMSPDRIELVRQVPAAGYPPRIVLRAVPDGADRLRLLRRGQAHVVWPMAAAHVPQELRRPGMAGRFTAYLMTRPVFDVAMFRLDRPFLRRRDVRRALAAAMPRAEVAAELGGLSVPARPPPASSPAFRLDLAGMAQAGARFHPAAFGLPVRPDPSEDERGREVLRRLLAAELARWPPRKLPAPKPSMPRILLLHGPGRTARAEAGAVASALGSIGILAVRSSAPFSYLRDGPLARGAFDVAIVRLAWGRLSDPRPYFHSRGARNIAGLADATIDRLLDAYAGASTREERLEALRRIQVAIADEAVLSVLHVPAEVILLDGRLAPPRFDLLGLDLASLRFSEG